MNHIDMESALQVNTFGFNLPCRQFAISAERTRERRLPMVDEFILRTLYVVQSIPAARLARFFGFEGRDLGISLSELQSKGFVDVDGETLSLTKSGKELFRTSEESAPTITATEPMHADVWFDLVAKHMVSGRGLKKVQHLIQIQSSASREAFDVEEARNAFHTHFRDYLKIARNDKNADQWSLYSIIDVHPGRYSFAQIGGDERLSLDPVPKLETFLVSTQLDYANRTRKLTEAMVSELTDREHVESSHAARMDFSRLAGNKLLDQVTHTDGSVDLIKWLAMESAAYGGLNKAFVGYPYVERNRTAIANLMSNAAYSGQPLELWWLRPGGSKWGVTEDLPATLELLRSTARTLTRGQVLATTLISPASIAIWEAKKYQRVFDRGIHAKAGRSSIALEVMAIPGLLAVVTVMVALSASVSVPIGFVTVDPIRVETIVETSQLASSISEAERLWPSPRPAL